MSLRESPPAVHHVHSLALVDDHQLVSLALSSALADAQKVRFVGGFPSVDALLEAEVEPGLVLLDLRLADGTAPGDNVRRLRTAGSGVLVFTSAEDPYLMREALRADVLGILRKSTPVAAIVRAVERAALGLPAVTSEWAHAMEHDPRLQEAGLSPQESRVLRLFADGASASSVAERLFITPGTLEDYVRRIRAKYVKAGRPAPTKIDLYKRAVEDGLLPGPGRR